MIDKDQILPIRQMIKEFYDPVMLRTIVNMVLMDMAHLTLGLPSSSVQAVLMRPQAQKALLDSLESVHRPHKHDLIDTILREYGLNLRKDELEFYHREMGGTFDKQMDYVVRLVKGFKYVELHDLSKVIVN